MIKFEFAVFDIEYVYDLVSKCVKTVRKTIFDYLASTLKSHRACLCSAQRITILTMNVVIIITLKLPKTIVLIIY